MCVQHFWQVQPIIKHDPHWILEWSVLQLLIWRKNLPITWPSMGASHEGAAVAGNQLDTTLLSIRCDQLSQNWIRLKKKWKSSWITYIYIYHVQQVNPCKSTTGMSLFLAIHVCLPRDTQKPCWAERLDWTNRWMWRKHKEQYSLSVTNIRKSVDKSDLFLPATVPSSPWRAGKSPINTTGWCFTVLNDCSMAIQWIRAY